MKTRVWIWTTAAALAAAAILTGCEPADFSFANLTSAKSPAPQQKPDPLAAQTTPPGYFEKTSVKTGTEGTGGDGAVKEAMDWMHRYLKEVEKNTQTLKEKRALEDQNRDLTDKLAKAEADLKQARKELDEANAMLLRLNNDLKAWKKDILGYREEMRAAHQQTVAGLGRVLQLLGGEVPRASGAPEASSGEKPSAPKYTPSTKESANAPGGS